MLDLSQFADIAVVEQKIYSQPDLEILNPPHSLAGEVISQFGGIRMIPQEPAMNLGVEVFFDSHPAIGYQDVIRKLGNALNRKLFPFGCAAFESGILLLSEHGEVFGLSVNSFDVTQRGSLNDALKTLLMGFEMKPVLPVRPYRQEHGFEVYDPNDPRVYWVDAPEWIIQTKA